MDKNTHIRGCQCSIIRRLLSHVFSTKNTVFQPLKSDWSKPKKAAIITVTAIIHVFGYCENDNLFFPKVICRKWRIRVSFAQSAYESTMLSCEHEAAEQRFCYIALDGATRCVNWFAVCVFALSNGDYEAMDSFLRSLKHEAGLIYICPKLNQTQVSRRRHLLTLAACVQDVLGKSSRISHCSCR